MDALVTTTTTTTTTTTRKRSAPTKRAGQRKKVADVPPAEVAATLAFAMQRLERCENELDAVRRSLAPLIRAAPVAGGVEHRSIDALMALSGTLSTALECFAEWRVKTM